MRSAVILLVLLLPGCTLPWLLGVEQKRDFTKTFTAKPGTMAVNANYRLTRGVYARWYQEAGDRLTLQAPAALDRYVNDPPDDQQRAQWPVVETQQPPNPPSPLLAAVIPAGTSFTFEGVTGLTKGDHTNFILRVHFIDGPLKGREANAIGLTAQSPPTSMNERTMNWDLLEPAP